MTQGNTLPRQDVTTGRGHVTTAQYKDIFGVLQGRNIVFCLDTSGSMYEHLAIIVHQLHQVLKERLTQDTVTLCTTQFNVISFSTLATKWSEEPVTLTLESLQHAFSWLKELETGTNSNTLDALLQAFADCTVDTVYLVTDGLPDQRPALVIECVLRNNRTRPIIAVSIGAGSPSDILLTDLASVTGGSFRPVSLPLKLPDPAELAKLPKGAAVLLYGGVLERGLDTTYLTDESRDLRWTGDVPPAYPVVRVPPPPESVVKFTITMAGRLMLGKDVLARHPARGDYHKAVIVDQHSTTCFEVQFPKSNERCQLCHIFHVQDALMHTVTTGDHVLAPLKNGGPYEPGNVVRGEDTLRGTNYNGVKGDIMVVLYSGLTVMCRPGTAIWLSTPVYNRMVTELRIVPSTKSSMEAVEALKISEHNPTSPADLQEYVLCTNNGGRDADVCLGAPPTVVADVPRDFSADYVRDDTTDQDTIVTTLSELYLREEETTKEPTTTDTTTTDDMVGYMSGILAEQGQYDELLGVPDHPRFESEEDEDEEEEEAPPAPWCHVGKASEAKKSPLSKPLTNRAQSVLPKKIDVNFNEGRRAAVLKSKERTKREGQRKQEKLLLAKSRIAHRIKEQDAMRATAGIQITRDTLYREGVTGQAVYRAQEKRQFKNPGSHQQAPLSTKDAPIAQRTTVTVRNDKLGRFSGYTLSTRLSGGRITHVIPPTNQAGSREAEHHVISAVSHAVQTDNRYYVSRA